MTDSYKWPYDLVGLNQFMAGSPMSRMTNERLKKLDEVTEDRISIHGLDQKQFELFVDKHGHRFREIQLSRCRTIKDFSPLEMLTNLERLLINHNIRATKLWDLRYNARLRSLRLMSLIHVHDLSPLAQAPQLIDLEITGGLNSGWGINSLNPLSHLTRLKYLCFYCLTFEEPPRISDLLPLTNLEKLNFPPRQFTTEQVAWFKARYRGPQEVRNAIQAYTHSAAGKTKFAVVTGVDKILLELPKEEAKLKEYVQEFEKLVKRYEANPKSPEPKWHATKTASLKRKK